LAIGFLKLIPDGRKVPLAPNAGKYVAQTLPELFHLLAAGRLKPVVAARIPLVEAARAHELLEGGQYAGKVVLVTGA
jgi:NADPH:quinone reductase-like Zn-dependent oxidoreductase